MKNLWNKKEFLKFSKTDIDQRVYSSRLLGQNPELVLHGGGNTSVKGIYKNVFGEKIDSLFIKGSGWDLISIERDGFAPVNLSHLIKLANLEKLSDTQMVIEQSIAKLKPDAPNPSVEAILHALIPYKFVDHTHANSVLSITNTSQGKKIISEIYDDEILIVPYVMPGFILAKKIAEMTRNVNWKKLKGMILMNHGVFSFGDSAKESYDRMIEIVTDAERYIKKRKAWRKYKLSKSETDLIAFSKIRRKTCEIFEKPCVALLNNSPEAVGFSNLKSSKILSKNGTLTPDHVIRTKPFAWVIKNDIENSSYEFVKSYNNYFNKNKSKGIKKLDSAPRWALWEKNGTISFGDSYKSAKIVYDINEHTIRAMQTSEEIDNWKPISFKNLFEVEYWDLEQAKLNKSSSLPSFSGKIAIVTGAASGIGYACAKELISNGCCVVGLDKNPRINQVFKSDHSFVGIKCDLTNSLQVKKAVKSTISLFGGLDILISNAGVFSSTADLDEISDQKWKKDIDINLTSHHKILRECIPFLKLGYEPSVIFIGSRNVGAPGPGAGTYTVAKAGLTQMSRLAAIELSKNNIRVNTIHPDSVYDTGVWSKSTLEARAKKYKMSVKNYKSRNLLKTEVSSKDVAELVIFLSSGKSIKTTGAQIPIDGGNDRII
tara:strand:+ start:3037 stop:5010 length:1974 start_codon:yes stop_codon:yes gene_type:complete